MTQINVIKIVLFIAVSFSLAPTKAQEIPSKKIYLLFEENDGNYSDALGKKFIDEDGLNFNLLGRTPFVHKKNHSRDTLSICALKHYPLTKESEIDEIEKKWWKKNLERLQEKYKESGLIPPFNRNGVFDPYIIEKIGNDKMVIYQVDFRNEGVVQ